MKKVPNHVKEVPDSWLGTCLDPEIRIFGARDET